MGFFDKQAVSSDAQPFRFVGENHGIVGVVKRIGTPFQGKNIQGKPNVTSKGHAIYTLPVELETEDGLFTLFVEGWAMTQAIGDAFRAAGLDDLQEGVTLGVKRLTKVQNKAGFMAWEYTAKVAAA